jgi:hypothetical protein
MAFRSSADFGGRRLFALPASESIKPTTVFIVEGYSLSQEVIKGLNSKFPIYLKSENERIPLFILETHRGQYSVTQALLKPEKPLIPGKNYQLIIDSLPEGEAFGSYNANTHQYDPLSYVVTGESDEQAPVWIHKPVEKDKSQEHFGCGYSIQITFSFKAEDQSDILVKTTVKSVESGKETVYVLPAGTDVLYVGHGKCSGAFNFDDGTNYQAKFTLMDASGNVSEETDWVAFTWPVD